MKRGRLNIPIAMRTRHPRWIIRMGTRFIGATNKFGTAHTIHIRVDEKGRVWFTARIRGPKNPDYCKRVPIFLPRRSRRRRRRNASSRCTIRKRQVFFDRHVLRHAASVFRSRCQQHTLDQRRRPGQRRGGMAQHEDVSGDRRREEIARLDSPHHRHQRQRQARRLRGGQSAARSQTRQAHHGGILRRPAQSRRRFVWGQSWTSGSRAWISPVT